MGNIFRVPVDNQHFKDTIQVGKNLQELSKFLNPIELEQFKWYLLEGTLRYWGSTPGANNVRNFEKMQSGDEILFYRSGQYIGYATIAAKLISRPLAEYSWGKLQAGATWELIYVLSNFKQISINSTDINQAFGYNDGPVMGFSSIAAEKVDQFNKVFGTLWQFIQGINQEQQISDRISEEIAKLTIHDRFEAQFYLVDLGNQLGRETYVPPSDAGHEVFGKKLQELVTVRKADLEQYVAPAIFRPMSNIDVIWFKSDYRPDHFFEVIHRTGLSEALHRFETVSRHFESAGLKVVGPEEGERDFENNLYLWRNSRLPLHYRSYNQLVNVHSATLSCSKLVSEFLT